MLCRLQWLNLLLSEAGKASAVGMSEGTTGFQLGVIGSLALSVASSVSIVICNKALISSLGFPFGLSFVSHPLCFVFSLSLSLSLYDDEACHHTFHGAAGDRLPEEKFQMTNTIQKRFKVSSTQLLYQSSPYQAAILFVTGPFVDQLLTKRSVFAYSYSLLVLVYSPPHHFYCTFLVIGTTSPVTYQVLGHLKTCLLSWQMTQKETTPLLTTKTNDKEGNESSKKVNGVHTTAKDSE
ncbi:hypothetical protein BHE74_00052687 [Ensete ventricosum]|nr:hypothetical protein GW17_00007640 [Ensete ventricosum]RWW41805.1 hypothetical protein BHE74_00052687 [Ensete ventricosum]